MLDAEISIGLGADRLNGVKEFADFIGEPQRRVFYLLERGLLPGAKLGGRWVGSRHLVRQHMAKLVAGSVAA